MLLADGLIDLRLGRWQEVLADVETCDSIVADPPYSARTHDGSDAASEISHDGSYRAVMGYEPMTSDDVRDLLGSWLPRCKSWALFFCDDTLAPAYRAAARDAGRFDFPPVPVLQHKPRLQGDGPAPGAVYFMASRPRERRFLSWGSLPGWYEAPPAHGTGVMGAKPLPLMQAIVRDYTRPGDLVVDPFCGGGTTALACAIEGRRCITSEMDPVTYEKTKKRLERGFTPSMFRQGPRVKAKQGEFGVTAKKDQRVESNKRVKKARRERVDRRSSLQKQMDGGTVDPAKIRIPGGEINPNRVDVVLANAAFAKRWEGKEDRIRSAMDAAKNPRFPCPDCGSLVRLGARGGLWDMHLRGPHYRFCGGTNNRTPEEIEAMRTLAAASKPQAPMTEYCEDCGYHAEHCRC